MTYYVIIKYQEELKVLWYYVTVSTPRDDETLYVLINLKDLTQITNVIYT